MAERPRLPEVRRDCRACGEAQRQDYQNWAPQVLRLPGTVQREGRHRHGVDDVPLHVWLQAIYLLCSSKKGISTRQLQRAFGCGLKTAWFLSHRVREAMNDLGMADTGPLGGEGSTVEIDESYSAAWRRTATPPSASTLGAAAPARPQSLRWSNGRAASAPSMSLKSTART